MELNKCKFGTALTTCGITKEYSIEELSESKYSKIDQVKFVEDSL